MFSSLSLSLDKNQFTFRKQTGKEEGRGGEEGRINGYQETTYRIKTRVKKNKIKKIDGKIVWNSAKKKVSIGKELISKAFHSRAEPSVTYSQLSRSYFCVTFPICNFRAAFTSNHPAASRNLPSPSLSSIYLFAYSSLSRPSNFNLSLSLSRTLRSNFFVSVSLARIN